MTQQPRLKVFDKIEKEYIEFNSVGFDDEGNMLYVQAIDDAEMDSDIHFLDREEIVLCWWTGFNDMNDQPIYDYDVIVGPHDCGPGGWVEMTGVVKYNRHTGYQLHYFDLAKCEVIGNVLERPELRVIGELTD